MPPAVDGANIASATAAAQESGGRTGATEIFQLRIAWRGMAREAGDWHGSHDRLPGGCRMQLPAPSRFRVWQDCQNWTGYPVALSTSNRAGWAPLPALPHRSEGWFTHDSPERLADRMSEPRSSYQRPTCSPHTLASLPASTRLRMSEATTSSCRAGSRGISSAGSSTRLSSSICPSPT